MRHALTTHLFKKTFSVSIAGILCLFVTVLASQGVHAATVDFNPGKIIDDAVFTNRDSMGVGEIQNFLNIKGAGCTNGESPCLKNFSEGGRSAAQIIYDTAQAYNINPQTLIVVVQKEVGLVTANQPGTWRYTSATGYGCPDSSPGVCNANYRGFTNQLRWTGTMFHAIMTDSSTWYTPYNLGNNNIRWNPSASCGSSIVNIQNRATKALYNYTPYRPNQAALNAGYGTGDGCSSYGNRNFYLYYRDWFGYNGGPAAFKTAGSPTIYVPVEGYKVAVPYAAVMQDYGISFEAVATVSQAYMDAIPVPPAGSNISSSIAHLVKSPSDSDADGGSIYLISRGYRYQIQSMEQFNRFGFQIPDISYLPMDYILAKTSGGWLSNFVSSPYGNVFNVTDDGKRTFFEYSSYINRNPTGPVTAFSYYLIDRLPSGNPISDRPILVKYSDQESVHLYYNDKYYSVSNYDVYSCWGFSRMPAYRTTQNNYIAPIVDQATLNSCVINDGQNNVILNDTVKIPYDTGYGITAATVDNDIKTLATGLPLRSPSLKQYVKANDSAAVWYLDSGTRRPIPTYANFVALGLNDSSIDIVSKNVIAPISPSGVKLADGQLVKDSSGAAVFAIAGNKRIAYPSSELFLAYKNDWNAIESYSAQDLNKYPYEGKDVSDYLVNTSKQKTFIIARNGCFELTDATLSGLGKTYAGLSAAQSYNSSIFRGIDSGCSTSSNFIKLSDQSLVYWVENGTKHALNTYNAMLSRNNGASPSVMEVSSKLMADLPTGSSYN